MPSSPRPPGLPFALPLAIFYGFDRLTGTDIAWSVAGGVVVACGFACFYTAMGRGLISVVAPVAAATGAIVPVGYALIRGERPGDLALIGIVIALVAISVVSIAPADSAHRHIAVTPAVIGLSVLAGGCFGLFYVCFSRISAAAGMWPVAFERLAATATLTVVALVLTRGPIEGTRRLAPFAVGVGALEVAATVPLLLALQRGPCCDRSRALVSLPRDDRAPRRNAVARAHVPSATRRGRLRPRRGRAHLVRVGTPAAAASGQRTTSVLPGSAPAGASR